MPYEMQDYLFGTRTRPVVLGRMSESTPLELPKTTELFGFVAGPFETNCYVVIDRAGATTGAAPATVIDPGFGAADTIARLSQERDFFVEKVVLTHGHIDHVRDAGLLEVPVEMHPGDIHMISQSLKGTPYGELFDVDTMKNPKQITHLAETVEMGGATWEVHHMPGHSPGSVMLRAGGLIFGGDVLFRGGVGRTDLPFSSPEDMMLSLKRLVSDFNDDDVVLPGHGMQTTIGQEKATNPFLQAVN